MTTVIRVMALAAFCILSLGACTQSSDNGKKPAVDQAVPTQAVNLPVDAKDTAAWKKYLVSVVKQNMQGITSSPYMYFVPSGDDEDTKVARKNQLDNVQVIVGRTVLPGNMMAFGGPDSKTTADLMIESFKEAKAGAFKGVTVLFVGAAADVDRAKAAIAPSGAEFRFVEMK